MYEEIDVSIASLLIWLTFFLIKYVIKNNIF